MWTWPALLITPSLVIGEMTLAFALTSPACAAQGGSWLHLVPALAVLIAAILTALALAESRRRRADLAPVIQADGDTRATHGLFVAHVASGVGILSTLVLIALWIPVWVISPCLQ
ncbi:MAG: hypothetical protein EOP38_15880 [Rubrivivax sp.]|nr:MAG: hypothetical protein EOP38_15880 [Rubrivivax sp.]